MIDPVALLVAIILAAGSVLYTLGWRRLRRRGAQAASVVRLVAFWFAILLVALVFLSPLNWLNQQYLFMRNLQTVILLLIAAPAFYNSCAYTIIVAGLPRRARRAVHRTLNRAQPSGRLARRLTPAWALWFVFLGCFLVWYDPNFVNWSLSIPTLHTTLLAVMGIVALLFWWQMIGTGPRLHPALLPWMAAVMLVINEVVNMGTGVSMAFSGTPFYRHYVEAAQAMGSARSLTVLEDQQLGGGLIWVAGSLIYVSTIVLVLNRLFIRHGADRPSYHADWDSEERMIAPGLEHRVRR